MKHTRLLFVLVLCFFVLTSLTAAVHTSVPVDHAVYRILDVAQIRGLIDNQIDVKPYSASRILSLLQTIASKPETLSKSELEHMQQLIASLKASYGYEPSDLQSLLTTGYLRSYDAQKGLGASFGITVDTQQTFSLSEKGEYDSRNALVAFLKSDIGSHISFNMDFGLVFDKLNN